MAANVRMYKNSACKSGSDIEKTVRSKYRKSKKFTSLILTLSILVSFFVLPQFSASAWSGSGTSSYPYLISSTNDWLTLATNVKNGTNYNGKYFKLTKSLSASGNSYIIGGGEGGTFCGTFEGSDYTMTLTGIEDVEFGAIFSRLGSATIKDLYTNVNIQNCTYAGGLTAYADSALIFRCSSKGTIYGNEYAGGIAAEAYDSIIDECFSDADIESNEGNGSSASNYNYAGGIVGYCSDTGSSIKNCYLGGNGYVSGGYYNNSGGIVGNCEGPSLSPVIKNCYVVGSVFGSYNSYAVGGVKPTGCYVRGDFNGFHVDNDVTSLTASQFANQSSFVGWDFTNKWVMQSGMPAGYDNDYTTRPMLRNHPDEYTLTPTYKAPTARSLTYTGSAQQLINAGSVTAGGTMEYSLNNSNWSTSASSITGANAGTYTVYYRILAKAVGSGGYKSAGPYSFKVTINKAAPMINTRPTGKSLTYTSGAQELINGGSASGGTMKYCTTRDGTYSTTIPTGTNAGTYKVYYKVFGDSNHSDLGPYELTSTIGKVNPTFNAPAERSLNYTGKAQNLVNAGSAAGGTMYYYASTTQTTPSLTASGWSTAVPSKTDAGTYYVYYKIVGDDNHNVLGAYGPITVSINKVNPTYSAPAGKELLYTGSNQALITAGKPSGGTMEYCVGSTTGTWSTSIPQASAIGTYKVYYRVVGNGNYNGVAESTSNYVTATISNANPTYTAPTANTLTYTGKAQALLTAGSVTKGGTMQYCLSENGAYSATIPTGTAAGTYTVWYKVFGTTGYNTVGPYSVNVTIGKAASSAATKPVGKTLTYSGSDQALITAGTAAGGTMEYCVGSITGTWSKTIPQKTAAGTYKVYYRVDGDDNHNDVAENEKNYVTATISKANPTHTAPTGKELIYNGANQALVTAGKATGGTMEYCLGSTTGTWSTAIPQAKDIGTYKVYYRVDGDDNHNDVAASAENYVTATIESADPTYTVPKAKSGLVYTGKAQALVDAGSVTKGGTMQYCLSENGTYSTAVPTGTDAKAYTVWYKVVGAAGYNSVAPKSISVTIGKANPVWSGTTSYTKTYGTDKTFKLDSAVDGGGKVTYTSDNEKVATVSGDTVTIVGAGSATITAAAAASANYNAPAARQIKLTVNKAATSWSGTTTYTLTYGTDKDFELNSAVEGGGKVTYTSDNEKVVTVSGNTVTIVGAGNATITASAAASDNYNAPAETQSILVTVKKGTPVWSGATTYTKNFGEEDFDLDTAISGGAKITWTSSNQNVATVDEDGKVHITGVGMAQITASAPATDNYNAPANNYTITLMISSVAPDAPASATATSGLDSKVELTWTAPEFTGGAPVTSYEIARSESENSGYTPLTTLYVNAGDDLVYTDKEAVNGTTYYYRIYAITQAGKSAKCAQASAKPYVVSKAVTISEAAVTGVGADEKQTVHIKWTAPADNGGDIPSSYKIEVFADESCTTSIGSGEYTVSDQTLTAFEADCAISAEHKGEKVYARIIPVNKAGDGEAAVYELYSTDKPDAPADFVTTPTGEGVITAAWSEGAYIGHSEIVKYKVSYRVHGSGAEFTTVELDPNDVRDMAAEGASATLSKKYTYDIENLQIGTLYDIYVTASNICYESDRTKVNEQLCAGYPLAPVIPEAMITKDKGVFVKLAECPDNKGGAIEEYVFYARKNGSEEAFAEFARVKADADETISNAYVKGDLVNGETYDICASVVNMAGESEKSEAQTVTVGLPSRVENVHIVPQAGQIMHITWDASDGNGSPIIGYELKLNYTIRGKWQDTETIRVDDVTEYDYQALGGINGDRISVQICAINRIDENYEGKSIDSDKVTSRVGAPSTPKLTTFETGLDGVSLGWTESKDNGNAMSYYTVYITDITHSENRIVTMFKTQDADSLNVDITQGEIDETGAFTTLNNNGEIVTLLTQFKYPFEDGHKYSVYVTATSSAGEGEASNIGEFTFASPSKPKDVISSADDGKLTVKWNKPDNDGGYNIVGYNIYLNDDEDPTMKVEWIKYVNGKPETEALNDEPAQPTDPAVTEAPAESADPTPTPDDVKYQLMVTDYRKMTKGSAKAEPYGDGQSNLDSFEVVIDNLANGYAYTASVAAINTSGEGPVSSTGDPETPRTLASEPLGIKTEGISGSEIKTSWKQPLSNGGTPITKYIVRACAVSEKNYETGEYEDIEPKLDSDGNKIYDAVVEVNSSTSCTVGGLKPGFGYVLEITAYTEAGEGKAASSDVTMTHTKPGKPVITSVDSAVGTAETLPVTVTWEAPEDNGGSEITGYDVYVGSFKFNKTTIPADQFTYTIDDNRVKNGKKYVVKVVAYNGVAKTTGVASDGASIMVGSIPAPKNVTAVAGDNEGDVKISWDVSQYAGIESYVSRYMVYMDGELQTSTLANNALLELVELGVKHKIEVSAIMTGTLQEGNKSAPVYITLGTTDPVTNVQATAGQKQIKVTWDPSTEDPNTDYYPDQYIVYLNGKAVKTIGDGISKLDPDNTSTEVTLTDVVGGKEYEIAVTAHNKYGESAKSVPVKATPWDKPDEPEVSDIKPALGSFSFLFKDGSGNGAAIYEHNIYLDGAKLEAVNYTIEGNKVTVKNVSDGGAGHTFCITAVNEKNLESDKPKTEYTIITGVPLAPSGIRAISGVASAKVTFNRSEDIDNHPITAYNVYRSENGTETLLAEVPARDENGNLPEGGYAYDVTGLENGTEYTFMVSASNDLGESERKAVSVKIGTPTAPTIESVTPSSGKLDIKWNMPDSENAGKITKYGVYVNGVQALTTPETSTVINGLENGREYVITISAYNYVGEGTKSDSVKSTPGGTPDKVTDIEYELTYNDTDKCGVVLKWKAPADTGGLEITGYKVTGEGNIVVDGRKATITGLEAGTDYTWDITAYSDAGEGGTETTETITTLNVPGMLTLVGVESTDKKFTITWKAPENTGGAEITSYKFYFKPTDGGTELYEEVDTIPNPNQQGEMVTTIGGDQTGLIVGQQYDITVTAVNTVGEGERSNQTRSRLIGSIEKETPSEPTNVKAAAGDTKVTISWSAPISDGGSDITSYTIYRGTNPDSMGYIADVDKDTYSYTDSSLTNGTTYYYKVKAVNEVDADGGPFSGVVNATPIKINAPTEPTWPIFNDGEGVSAYETSAIGDEMTFTWIASAGDTLGGDIKYEVYVNGDLKMTTADTKYVMQNPESNKKYNVQIRAFNEAGGQAISEYIHAYRNLNIRKGSAEEGFEYDEYYKDKTFAQIDSDYDGVVDYQPVYGKPSAPENVEITQSTTESKAIVTWDAPSNTGNKEITGYNLYIYTNGETKTIELDKNGLEKTSAVMSLFAANDMAENTSTGSFEYDFGINYGQAYSVYLDAVNEEGKSDKTAPKTLVPLPETPTELKAELIDHKDIALTWKLVNVPESYVLYIDNKPEPLDKANVTTGSTDATGYTTYTYTYTGEINHDYTVSVSAVYIDSDGKTVESVPVTPSLSMSTWEDRALAPTISAIAKSETDHTGEETAPGEHVVTVKWSEPSNAADVDIDHYKFYVNGEEYTGMFYINGAWTDSVPSGTVEAELQGIDDKSLIKLSAISSFGTEGDISKPEKYNAEQGQEFGEGTPGKPVFTDSDYELVRPDGILAETDNLTITWKSASEDSVHNVLANRFDIYFGTVPQGSVEASIGDNGEYTYSYTLTVTAGIDYNVRIVPVYTQGEGEVVGEEASQTIQVPENEYPAPVKPALTAQLSSDKSKITLDWTAENQLDGVKYTLTVNGTDQGEITSPYEYNVEDGVTNYIFSVTAVKTYDLNGGTKSVTTKSDDKTVSLSNGGDPVDPVNPTINPPVITKTLSNVLKVKVFWNAPTTTDGEGNETAAEGVTRYDIVADGTVIGSVLPDNADGLCYEITGFTSLTDKKEIVIHAVMLENGTEVPSISGKWTATPSCNIQDDADKYAAGDSTGITGVDKDGDGRADDEGANPTITIPLSINTTGTVHVAITDNFTNEGDVVCESDVELTANGLNGTGNITINESDVTGENRIFTITISKEAFTTYTITNVTYADLKEINIDNAVIYLGDINNDGFINLTDRSLVMINLNKWSPENAYIDINKDGNINLTDRSIIMINLEKEKVSEDVSSISRRQK